MSLKKILFFLLFLLFFPLILYSYPSSSLQDSCKTVQEVQAGFTSIPPLETDAFAIWEFVRALLCIVALLALSWLLSSNRKAVSWRLVLTGLSLQFLLAAAILYLSPVQYLFEGLGKVFLKIIDFSNEGARFVFGPLAESETLGAIFAFQVLPTILFFSALMSVCFYLGIIQKVVGVLAWLLSRSFRISGQESLVVAANIFLGQNEAPLIVKAYLGKMSRSEIFMIMTAGMATIAGGVMAAYIGFLGGNDPVLRLYFARHLLAASVMAAPGAIVIAKIMMPAPAAPSGTIEIPEQSKGSNLLDAIAQGTQDGLKLAATVAAMLLVTVAFIWLLNYLLLKMGDWSQLNEWISNSSGGFYQGLSMQFLLAKIFQPLLWLTGVEFQDASLLGRLLGEKLVFTEFIAYVDLSHLQASGAFVEKKSVVMATYLLCGFANFASIGIQIGGIGSLAPSQRINLSQLGMKALLAGTITSLISATMVGMLF